MVDFLDVINTISSITPNFVHDTFKVKALNKELLCVFLPGSSNSILLYDENCGLNNVGEIRYVIRDGKCFVSTFETDKNFQQMGIGRFMFNLALAHADAVGAKQHMDTQTQQTKFWVFQVGKKICLKRKNKHY